ncbi:hypothetical protein AMR41_08390 [Hapalosiphon sp. MRB220]|nr:hypothetical protein AMR41_08390 [Hapalosiphon sp. MRB220]
MRRTNFKGGDFTKADFRNAILEKSNFSEANLQTTNFSRANLEEVIFYKANLWQTNLSEAILIKAELTHANLIQANLIRANLTKAELIDVKLIRANLEEGNLEEADMRGTDLRWVNLSKADLSNANLTHAQVMSANLTSAKLTGACIQDWNISNETILQNVICEFVYLRSKQRERIPINRNFLEGEFTKLFQKTSNIIELIFNDGVDWISFAYSLGRLQIENEDAQLEVQSIEKKGDGIVVVKVSTSQDTNKEKLYKEFMQGYEFAHKVLEEKYRAELSSKDAQISHYSQENQSQRENINNLFNLLQRLTEVQKLMVENPRKISNYDLRHSQLAGGIADAEIIHTKQIGGDIHNNDNQERPN